MVKYLKLLIFSFLATSISSLYTMEEGIEYLSKNTIKDMIIKYPIEETSYLTELLSLSREAIKNKLNQSPQKEAEKYSECEEHYAQDLKETKDKAQQIETRLKKEKNTKLLESLKIQNFLIQEYEAAIKEEKLVITQKSLEKMSFLIEVLYFTSTTQEELNENKKLYKQLSLKFHPDKIKNLDENIKQETTEFFKTFTPLLNKDTNSNHLVNIVRAIREKRNEIIDQVNNPSISTYAAHFFCSTALPTIGHGLGIALCHKTFAQIMPRSAEEHILSDICVANARRTALDIETKLVKIPHHP